MANYKTIKISQLPTTTPTKGQYVAVENPSGKTFKLDLSTISIDTEELDKHLTSYVNGARVEGSTLYLTNGDKVISELVLPAGGGNSDSSTIRLKNLISNTFPAAQNAPVLLKYNFVSTDSVDGTATGNGTATYTVNGRLKASINTPQGDVTFDISKYLELGDNKVTVKVIDSYDNSRTLTYNINLVNLTISSSYNPEQINESTITFRYTPLGAIMKTIYFELDGKVIHTEETNLSNRQMTFNIPAQTHGSHPLKVYMKAEINGVQILSNTLYYELICVKEGNNTVIISSPFASTTVEQYSTTPIRYIVYNPASSTAKVSLIVDNVEVSSLNVDQTTQTWNYKAMQKGNKILQIKSGASVKSFNLTVKESSINVEAETLDLELYLTAAGRSNSETNPAVWKYKDIEAQLTGFNFKTDGWIIDKYGSTSLKVSEKASVFIPFKIFDKDFKAGGKTIEFEFSTSEINDYQATVISCMNGKIGLDVTAQQAYFSSEQTHLEVKYKEEERVRVSFVVESSSDQKLIYAYINGVISAVKQYNALDNFMQALPQGITIGSDKCAVSLHTIRIYDNNLTQYQMLDNYIADLDDLELKAQVYKANQVYNDYGQISYSKLSNQLACLTIEGELPKSKGNPTLCKVIYVDYTDPRNSFTIEQAEVDVQGTSSQYYPRKNYLITSKSGFKMELTGKVESNYKLRPDSIPVNTFCMKADFAESSGTHNTGMGVYIDEMLKQLGFLTPAQKNNPSVRTTIDGFPIAIFHRSGADDELTFLGKYNFNNDKSTAATFGFSTADECWEVLNNSSKNVLFQTADFTSKKPDGGFVWVDDFEGRYPKKSKDITKLSKLCSWIASTKGNPDKFKQEAANHFNIDFLLFYYIVTEFFGMVDQRAKNMMIAIIQDKTYLIFYDNDTIAGLNNEGEAAFSYDIEYHDKQGTNNVWNGADSVLWNNVETAFQTEIDALYAKMRRLGILSFDKVVSYFDTKHSERWCESVYNEDSRFKYIEPLIADGNGSFIYAAQGNRKQHRLWWFHNRFKYMDSKYIAGDVLSDYITMRIYTPDDWRGVVPNANFRIIPSSDMYLHVKYGSTIKRDKGRKGELTTIVAPDIKFNDTETIIYGASSIASLGDLSAKYIGTLDVSMAKHLTELLIGSSVDGYKNTNMTSLNAGNNLMLKKVNLVGCINLRQAIDLSGCLNIEEVYATGTNITSVALPNAGNITILKLPAVSALVLKNQNKLDHQNLYADFSNITTLVLENCSKLNYGLIIKKSSRVHRVRIIGISGTSDSSDGFYKLSTCLGIDPSGNNTSHSIIEGSQHFKKIYKEDLELFTQVWKDLRITYDQILDHIDFTDTIAKSLCIANFDTNKDKELSFAEARSVTSLGMIFNRAQIQSFNELRFFTSLEKIDKQAFEMCNDLTNITIPSNVIHLEESAFDSCRKLSSIQLPDNLQSIGNKALNNCPLLSNIIIPSTVTTIGNSAFKQTPLVEIKLPAGLTSMGASAFSNCYSLKSIEIPDKVISIGNYTFNNCQSLESVKFSPNTTTIGAMALQGCKALKSLNIPSKVMSIGQYAFSSCTSLTNITLPTSIESTAVSMLSSCSSLASVYLPDNITTIEVNTFRECLALSEVRFSVNLTTIKDFAFFNCKALTSVVLPSKIASMGSSIFSGSGVETLTLQSVNPPVIEAYSLSSAPIKTIYVPAASVDAYKTAAGWSIYANIIKPIA